MSAYYNIILCHPTPKLLPPHLYTTSFCNAIVYFFTDKIEHFHQYLGPLPHLSGSLDYSSTHPHSFQFLTLSEITELIKKSKPSSCPPHTTVKGCLPSLKPQISAIINSSLITRTVPSPFSAAYPKSGCGGIRSWRETQISLSSVIFSTLSHAKEGT